MGRSGGCLLPASPAVTQQAEGAEAEQGEGGGFGGGGCGRGQRRLRYSCDPGTIESEARYKCTGVIWVKGVRSIDAGDCKVTHASRDEVVEMERRPCLQGFVLC